MNTIESMLSKKMFDADPTLDILGSDHKLLQVAYQDLLNYLRFNGNFANKAMNSLGLAECVEKLCNEDPPELESFLTVWTSIWLKKWKERVRLVIGKQNQDELGKISKALANSEPLWRNLESKQEMKEILVSALIRNAEVCGTEILAEYLLKMELSKRADQDVNGHEQVFAVLNGALRQARETSKRTGPLISLQIEKSYFCTVSN